MLLKLPFFNRERYIVIKAYTFDQHIHSDVPICITSKALDKLPRNDSQQNLSSCFGYIMSASRSFTMKSWTEAHVDPTQEDPYIVPERCSTFRNELIESPDYALQGNMRLTKILAPWQIECNKKDTLFVLTRHMMNKTPMMVVPGIINWDVASSPHVMNIIDNAYKYSIPYRHPLVQFFPMSDLPLHVEAYLDREKYAILSDAMYNVPHFRASGIKRYLENKT